ncbi:uncharacterized protein LOC127538759 [Antechinus flavipes]|uniref:uncharacterized protein LOC127538759 n=1 Tax=Antechinus flavipes TaxID=38775 RepID=UPI0022354F0D|nr:uncharacterized protein LOC127538759 [Antechinus flavipes]
MYFLDGSNWDSSSPSEINKSHRSSKNLNLQRIVVSKGLTQNPQGSTRDHPGENPNVKPSQRGLPMKESFSSQESEKGVKAKSKLDYVQKCDLPAAEDTDDGSNWDSSSPSEINKSHRSSKNLNLQRIVVSKGLTQNPQGSTRDHPGENPNVKPSQRGLPMKESFSSQESEKGVKAKSKLDYVQKCDLPAAEDTDDGSNWDSSSPSEINKSHRSSKNLNLQRIVASKALTQNLQGSTRGAAGSGPDTGYKVGLQVEEPGPQKHWEPPLEKEVPKRKKDRGLIL